MSMIGREYTCKAPGTKVETVVRVLARWRSPEKGEKGGPRNVLVREVLTGEKWTRPFRGLRRIEDLEGPAARAHVEKLRSER